MQSILLPAEQVDVLAECDVLVCGGGLAGVSTAVCAARHGAKVILLERWPFVGGMATAAFVNAWARCDLEKVVILGLTEEMVQLLTAGGWAHAHYPNNYETHWFDPEGMRIVAHRILDEAGVRVFCYTPVGQPIVEAGSIRGVVVETKLGRRVILGKIVVDATGDGDVAAKAGVDFEYGRPEDGLVQGMTLMFRLWKHDRDKLAAIPEEMIRSLQAEMHHLRETGELPPFNSGFLVTWLARYCNMAAVNGHPLDEEDLTRATVLATERLQQFIAYFRRRVQGCENTELDKQGFSLGIRESRRITGIKTLDAQMVLSAQKQVDAIGHGMWMVDIHDPKGSGYTTWSNGGEKHKLPPGQSYHIPLSICLNNKIRNLAVVGRCASSTHEGNSSVRLQTHCVVMGQGVGTCAAMALASGVAMHDVPVRALQAALKRDGVYLEDVPVSE